MFRKPRELASPLASTPPPKPSTGRPPTPEPITAQDTSYTFVGKSPKMTSSKSPLTGRIKPTSKSSTRSPALTSGKTRSKPNGSILNFFKKVTRSPETEHIIKDAEESLFLENEDPVLKVGEPVQTPTPPRDDWLEETSPGFADNLSMDEDFSRFNEENGPVKRQKMESPSLELKYAAKSISRKGPFIEDSDDGEEEEILRDLHSLDTLPASPAPSGMVSGKNDGTQGLVNLPAVPSLKQERTSVDGGDEFQGIDDFIDEEFPEEGEEYLERRWMEQQRQFEMDSAEDAEMENNQVLKSEDTGDEGKDFSNEEVVASCPLCSMGFDGLTDQVG